MLISTQMMKQLMAWNPKPITFEQFSTMLDRATRSHWKETQAVAPAMGVTLLSLEVKAADDIDHAFTGIRKERLRAEGEVQNTSLRTGGSRFRYRQEHAGRGQLR
jgi:hypothetical protein